MGLGLGLGLGLALGLAFLVSVRMACRQCAFLARRPSAIAAFSVVAQLGVRGVAFALGLCVGSCRVGDAERRRAVASRLSRRAFDAELAHLQARCKRWKKSRGWATLNATETSVLESAQVMWGFNAQMDQLSTNALREHAREMEQHQAEIDAEEARAAEAEMDARAEETEGLRVPPPVLSRVYQTLSDGMLGFNQADKLAKTPFPMPYAQMLTVLLLVFNVTLPVMIAGNVNALWLALVMNVVSVMAYQGLNETARELEDPFKPTHLNDLGLPLLQAEFNSKLRAASPPVGLSTPWLEE